MWNSFKKLRRLEAALRRRGLDPMCLDTRDLMRTLQRRGMPDRELNEIVGQMIRVLEPPACPMTHCKHYGHAPAPMNCGDGRIPGRCGILRAYKKRRAAREAAAKDNEPVVI